jgi:hypothetical protein
LGDEGGPLMAHLPGTAAAPPVGLECTMVYNNLVLNDRLLDDRYRITSISGFDDADIRDERELLSAQHGEVDFPAYYGGRTIGIRGFIEAGNMAKLRDMQMALRTAFAFLSDYPLYIYSPGNTANVMFQYVRKSGPLQMAEAQPDLRYRREFQLALRSSDPWMVALAATTTTVAAGSSTNINNIGNFYASPVITITGTSSLVNPVVNIGGYSLGFTYNVPNGTGAGAQVVIDVRARTIKTNTGGWLYSKVSTPTDWPWPIIMPGSNAVSITKSSGTGSVDIVWRPTWV